MAKEGFNGFFVFISLQKVKEMQLRRTDSKDDTHKRLSQTWDGMRIAITEESRINNWKGCYFSALSENNSLSSEKYINLAYFF